MLTRARAGIHRPSHRYSADEYLLAASTSAPSPLPSLARATLHDPHWLAVMQEEFDALHRNRTWQLVPQRSHANVISDKWVFRHKIRPDGTLERYKARWVVRGFRQRACVDFTDTFATVVKPGTICTVLQLAVSRTWPVHQMDVSNTFLHVHLAEQVYCQQPIGFVDATQPDHVCLLSRSLYGLQQAPRACGTAYLLLYIDDIILTASSAELLCQLIAHLDTEFAIKDLGPLHHFLGIEVYAQELLERAGLLNCKPVPTPIDTKAKVSALDGSSAQDAAFYRSIVGALQYLTLTRSDLQYAVQQELHLGVAKATVVYCDNVSAVYLSANPVHHRRTKHIELDNHFVREQHSFFFKEDHELMYTGRFRGHAFSNPSLVEDETADPKALPLSLLKDITNDFSNDRQIGRGGFAVVYKGVLESGTVAVKRLSDMCMDEKKFHGEVQCLMKARHKNIVRFLGYCADTQGNMLSYNGKLVMADVRQRLLCFEYMSKGSLRDYISDESCGLEWRKRYQIINGICQGLNYLHENRIVHLDLKPENVLLDDNMVPKITDFGLSRYFEERQTSQSITSNISGTLGYIAPELYDGEKITIQSDIYSLGIIIIEILTGRKGCPDVGVVLERWCERLGKSLEDTHVEQVRVCTEIGIECSDFNPAKRPVSTHKIIERLKETETTDEVSQKELPLKFSNDSDDQLYPCKYAYMMNLRTIARVSSVLSSIVPTKLFVHPHLLCFPCVPNKLIPSSLNLRNFTDEHFAFRLVESYAEETQRRFAKLPLYGVVSPRSTHTLSLTLQERDEKSIHLVLESSTFKDAHMPMYCSEFRGDKFLEETKEKGNMVQHVIVKAVATTAQRELTSEDNNRPYTGICLHLGRSNTVVLVKFIVRKQWFVAGAGDGFIHIYNYETKRQQVPSFTAHAGKLTSLAVHPSKPYLMSWSSDEMNLWDWDKAWECTQTFKCKHSGYICQVMFNPKNSNSFVTASANHMIEICGSTRPSLRNPMFGVQVWDFDSPQCKYTLSGHWDRVNCLDFFTHDNQQYLITGSSDCSAKVLITGLEDGTVYLWSSTNFRLERIINPPVIEPPAWGFGWLYNIFSSPRLLHIFLKRVKWTYKCYPPQMFVFGRGETVAMVDVSNVNNQEESSHHSVPQIRADTTTQLIDNSVLLEVHPSDLRFPLQPHKSTTCSLDLTNHTYERVAFRLVQKNKKSHSFGEEEDSLLSNVPIYGFIASGSTYTLVVTTKEWPDQGEDTSLDLLLQSSISGDKFIVPFENETECVDLFEELKEMGNVVHELTLKAVFYAQEEVTREIISATKKVDALGFGNSLVCLDAHPTETWILTCKFFGDVHMWDLVSQACSVGLSATVKFLKFIARKRWFLAGADDGFIHVCTYGTEIVQQIMSFRAGSSSVTAMTIHPTQPYVLSSAYESPIRLWNWEEGWQCTRTFDDEHSGTVRQITFNPKDANCFASASEDQTVKVWNLDSPKSSYTLFGHLAQVNCLDFFAHGDQQYLISGSDDLTARIWDLENRLPFAPLSLLSDRFIFSRLVRIIDLGCSKVRSVNLMGSVRVVIEQEGAVSIMDIDPEQQGGIISEVGANMVDAARLDVAWEAQLDIFQEPKEDLPGAVSGTGNTNSTQASEECDGI
uniref:Coatomer subunit beta'-2 n=1 Tax=Aegilops tauschii TaxID=37682 RepID=N1R3B6_AEGTA